MGKKLLKNTCSPIWVQWNLSTKTYFHFSLLYSEICWITGAVIRPIKRLILESVRTCSEVVINLILYFRINGLYTSHGTVSFYFTQQLVEIAVYIYGFDSIATIYSLSLHHLQPDSNFTGIIFLKIIRPLPHW